MKANVLEAPIPGHCVEWSFPQKKHMTAKRSAYTGFITFCWVKLPRVMENQSMAHGFKKKQKSKKNCQTETQAKEHRSKSRSAESREVEKQKSKSISRDAESREAEKQRNRKAEKQKSKKAREKQKSRAESGEAEKRISKNAGEAETQKSKEAKQHEKAEKQRSMESEIQNQIPKKKNTVPKIAIPGNMGPYSWALSKLKPLLESQSRRSWDNLRPFNSGANVLQLVIPKSESQIWMRCKSEKHFSEKWTPHQVRYVLWDLNITSNLVSRICGDALGKCSKNWLNMVRPFTPWVTRCDRRPKGAVVL